MDEKTLRLLFRMVVVINAVYCALNLVLFAFVYDPDKLWAGCLHGFVTTLYWKEAFI